MSHTDKDRPYWVKLNDEAITRKTDHNHLSFGQERRGTRYARDEQGNYIRNTELIEYSYTERVVRVGAAGRQGLTPADVLADEERYADLFRVDTITTKREPFSRYRRETFVRYTIADHCTEGEPLTAANHHGAALPCTPEPVNWDDIWGYGRGVDKYDRALFNGTQRARMRDSLRQYAKEVNGAEDWGDLDDSQIPNDRHRHTIIWW